MIVADNGSNFFSSGASYSVDASNNFALTWNDNDIQDSTHGLKSLTFSDFEVVDLTPVVTGLSASSGAAGSTVTVTGPNFSGAAGHLQVLFGNTAATNVTVRGRLARHGRGAGRHGDGRRPGAVGGHDPRHRRTSRTRSSATGSPP